MAHESGEASASHAGSSTNARVGIVADASCDVPDAFPKHTDVSVIAIPIRIRIRIRGQTCVDQHDPDAMCCTIPTMPCCASNVQSKGCSCTF